MGLPVLHALDLLIQSVPKAYGVGTNITPVPSDEETKTKRLCVRLWRQEVQPGTLESESVPPASGPWWKKQSLRH